jgi:tetratricopeptide (TPR) repeat protein
MAIIERRGRRPWWLVAIVLSLIGGGMGLWWVRSRAAVGLVPRGMSAYSRGDWDSASALARRRLKEAPDDGEALRLAARAMARQDRDQQAIAIYTRLDLGLMTPEDYFLLGRASARTGQDDSALKCLKAAQAVEPNRPETLNVLAEVYFRKDLHAAAEETAVRLAEQPEWEARGQLMLGIFRTSLNDPAGTVRALRRAFELDPTGTAAAPAAAAPFQKLLVRALLQTGQPAQARLFLRSLSSSETDPEASWLMSRCFLQEKDWEHAALALKGAGSYRHDYPLDPEPAPYVGAARCAACHPTKFRAVTASRHATTFSFATRPQAVPLPDRPVPDPGDPRVSHNFQRVHDGIRVESRVGDQVFRALAVYAFGSPDHFVTLVGSDDHGQSRMVRMSYYRSPKGTGWDISSGLDVRPAHPDEFLGRPLDHRDGERRCLSCHTTNFRAIEQQVGPEAADRSIGCEACHGPGGHHVTAVEAEFSDLAIVIPRQETPEAFNQMCARCHGLTHAEAVTGPDDDPGWLRFQNVTLSRSRCYTESGGKLNCVTCHDPHANAETSAPRNEAKCLACHSTAVGANHACPVNSSTGCIECHMPKIWVQATHSFKADHNIRKRATGRDSIHGAASSTATPHFDK